MNKLSKQEILAKVKLPEVEIEVPEWGTTLKLKGMTGKQRLVLAKSVNPETDKEDAEAIVNIITKLISISVVDETGNPMFSEDEAKALVDGDLNTASKVVTEIYKLNGINQEEEIKEDFLQIQN